MKSNFVINKKGNLNDFYTLQKIKRIFYKKMHIKFQTICYIICPLQTIGKLYLKTEVFPNIECKISSVDYFLKMHFYGFSDLEKQNLMVFLFLDDLNIVHTWHFFNKHSSRSLA